MTADSNARRKNPYVDLTIDDVHRSRRRPERAPPSAALTFGPFNLEVKLASPEHAILASDNPDKFALRVS